MSLKETLRSAILRKTAPIFEADKLITSEKDIKIPLGYNHYGEYVCIDKVIEKISNSNPFENRFYNAKEKKFIRITYRKLKHHGNIIGANILTNDQTVVDVNPKFGWEKSYKKVEELEKLL